MNKDSYMIEFKKIMRNAVKDHGNKDLKIHMNIIRSTLFFISKVILIKIKFGNIYSGEILIRTQREFDDDFKFILKDIESVEEYQHCESLDEYMKLRLINIIVKLESKSLREFSLGELYDTFTTSNEKKFLGQVYTPKYIVDEMINSSLKNEDMIENPYLKVIDPACGGGYFVIGVYDKIKKIITENYDKIIMYDDRVESQLKEGIDKFILENNIFGVDIDEFAVYMTRFSLFIRGNTNHTNIFKLDALLHEYKPLNSVKFDLVISNPPYIGHKKIDRGYRLSLSEKYSDVYSDKGDISYCFFKKGYELLNTGGTLCFITSRYFLESLSGKGLRNFISEKFTINKIIDFYGENIFKGVGVSPVIIECVKNKAKQNDIQIYKRIRNNTVNSFKKNIDKNFLKFFISQEKLKEDGWILLDFSQKNLFDKIDRSGDYVLKDLCLFNQGIITGYDEAFIINKNSLVDNTLELDLIKPWIKNSEVAKYYLKDIKRYIIYTNTIEREEDYPKTIERLNKYRDKLMKRRECLRGIRKWYELQWGRDERLLKSEKIIFPYKSVENKFTIARDEVYSSADVYSITIKEESKEQISLEYLVAFLNSKVYEYYFKCVAKKLNDKLYEYYPNKLINLKIKLTDEMCYIEDIVRKIEQSYKEGNSDLAFKLQMEIDDYFYKAYSLNRDEINLIENYLEGDMINE